MKNFKFYLIVWILLLAIFNVAVFVSPAEMAGYNKFGGAFWGGYISITLAFFGQLAASFFAFRSKNLQKFFYKIPLIRISWSGLVLTLIIGVACMAIPDLPNWVGIILCFAVLAFHAISLVKANTAAELVDEIDDKVKTHTLFIRSLTVDAETLIAKAKSETVKAECKKVYEAIRYSDPMSNAALVEVEEKIQNAFSGFENAVHNEDFELASCIADELLSLISIRNKKCILLK